MVHARAKWSRPSKRAQPKHCKQAPRQQNEALSSTSTGCKDADFLPCCRFNLVESDFTGTLPIGFSATAQPLDASQSNRDRQACHLRAGPQAASPHLIPHLSLGLRLHQYFCYRWFDDGVQHKIGARRVAELASARQSFDRQQLRRRA